VLLVGQAGRAAAGPAAGLTAAMLMATSAPMGIAHAATARPYAVLTFEAAAAALQSLALLGGDGMLPSRRRWRLAALTLTHLLGLWTHPVYVFVAIASALASIVVHRRLTTTDAAASTLAVAAYLLVWGPVLSDTFARQPTSWIQPPRIRDLQSAYLLLWGTGPGFMLVGALVAVGLGRVPRVREWLGSASIRWLCAAAVLAWLLPYVASFWKPVFVASRTPMLLLPLTTLLAGAALASFAGRAALVAFGVLFALAAAQRVVAGGFGRDPVPTRASVASVLGDARCGDTLLASGLAHAPIEYYLRRLGAPACVAYERFPADLVNWTGRIADPAEARRVDADARDLAVRLARRGGRVWLFTLNRGMGSEASAIIQSHLRASMHCAEVRPLRGAFFDGVVRCDAR
jgi:hypothetical protein